MLGDRKGSELSLNSLTRRFKAGADIAIPDETFNVTIDIRLLVYATDELIIFSSSRVTSSDAVIY